MICTLVLIKELYSNSYYVEHSFYDTLQLEENPLYRLISDGSPSILLHRTEIYTEHDPYSSIMDWFICYCVLIFSLTESIFNFQRYYMAKFTTETFENPNTISMVSEFSIYACIFCALFMLQIHFYFWLFPLVTIVHCCFNLYVTMTFNDILMERYTFYVGADEDDVLRSVHEEIMRTVTLISRSSLVSSVLSSVYILLFTIAYDVHIVIYIPLLWSASNIAALFNLVRNRTWFKRMAYIYCTNKCKWKRNIAQLSVIVSEEPNQKKKKQIGTSKSPLQLMDLETMSNTASPNIKKNTLEIVDNYSTNSVRTSVRLEIPSLADQNYKLSDHTSATTDLSTVSSNNTTPNTANTTPNDEEKTPQKTPEREYQKWYSLQPHQSSNSKLPMLSNQQTSSLKISVTNITPKSMYTLR